MFEHLHRGQKDQAMRAGVALAVETLLRTQAVAHCWILGYATHELVGMPEGLSSSSPTRWARYAEGVQRHIEKGDAHREYTAQVNIAAEEVAEVILDPITALLGGSYEHVHAND